MKKRLAAALFALLLVGLATGHANHDHTNSTESDLESQQPNTDSSEGFDQLVEDDSPVPVLVIVEIVVVLAALVIAARHYSKKGDGDGILELGGG